MKNRKDIGSKIAIAIVCLIVLVLICLMPNLIGKLQGTINSTNINSEEVINTVVLNMNKVYDYSNDKKIKLQIYNGSNNEIKITNIISRNYCITGENCDSFETISLETPITVASDGETEYIIESLDGLAGGGFIEVGIQYELSITDDLGNINTNTYNIFSYTMPALSFVPNNNSIEDEINDDNSSEEKTIIDKSSLLTLIPAAIEKLDKTDEEVKYYSYLEYYVLTLNAISLYEKEDKYSYCESLSSIFEEECYEKSVTQSEVDNISALLENNKIEESNSADYNDYNDLINLINSKEESWYPQEAYTKFEEVYNEKDNYLNLSSAYQIKVDNYVARLQAAFDELEETMYGAGYDELKTKVEEANELLNKTTDGGYNDSDHSYNYYSEESMLNLRNVINSIDWNLKIEDQGVVNSYVSEIDEAISYLEIASANYVELNPLIEEYKELRNLIIKHKGSEAYKNNFKTIKEDGTETFIDDHLLQLGITNDIKIDEQIKVDSWVSPLSDIIDKIKASKALGYVDEDNYVPVEGVLSLEGYFNYLKNDINRDLYTEESLATIDGLIDMYDSGSEEVFGITIDRQAEMDEILATFNLIYNGDYLEKKPGDYTNLCELYEIAINLGDLSYLDVALVNNFKQALWNIDWDLKIDEQEQINNIYTNLLNVINSLPANMKEFNEIYNKVVVLNSNHYVDFSSMRVVLDEANEFLNASILKQSNVDEVTIAMNSAYEALVLKDADYSKIETLKSKIEQLDKTKYTNFNIINVPLNNIIYGKKANEQELVDNMYNNLKIAYDNLQKIRADYTELNNAVLYAKRYELNKHNYTNFNTVENIINSIDYNIPYDKQEKVDSLTDRINVALDNLIKKPADYTELSNILSKIPNDYSNYDVSLQNEVRSFLQKAGALANNLKYDEQSKIDAVVKIGNELIKKLPFTNVDYSTDIILSYLKVNGSNVNISSAPFKHTVDYSVMEAEITVGLSSKDSNSSIYGGKILTPGNNNITIVVNDKNGKRYAYNLVIERLTTSNYLSDLSVKENKIEFNKTKQEYNVKVDKNTDELDLSAIAEDDDAKVTIKGNKSIKNGSKVTIEVESTDGSVRVYTLNVQKASSVDVSIILVLIIILAVLAGIFKFIQEKRKVDDKNNA